MKYYSPPVNTENETAFLYQNILQLTKEIDRLSNKYKLQSNAEAKKKIQSDMMDKLEKRFTLQEEKMELEIKKLSQGIENLQKELQKFKTDKEMIIQKQFEGIVD